MGSASILFYGTDVNTALMYSMVPHIIRMVTDLINGTDQKLGVSDWTSKFNLVLGAASTYGLLSKSDWGLNLFKGALGFSVIACTYMRLDPVGYMKVYGRQEPLNALSTFLLAKSLCYSGLMWTIQAIALLSGVDTLKSI